MEVDPPKEEAKKEGEEGQAAPEAPEGSEAPKPEDAEMKDAEAGKTEEPPKKEFRTEKRKKVVSKTIDLPVTSIVVGTLSRDKLDTALEQEKTFSNQDAYEANRLVAKNSVEEYIYNIREKISEELADYILEADREAFSSKLTDTEDWLYEDGEDCEKSVYEEKLKDLKMIGEAAKKRKTEFEARKQAVETLGHSIQMASKVVEAYKAGDEKYNHLTDAEITKVAKMIEEKTTWLNNSATTLEKTAKTANPTILTCQFYSERDAFEAMCRPIVNKPKPKVEPPKEEKADTKAKTEAAEDKKAKDVPMEESGVNGNGEQQQQTMDLD